MALSGGGAGSSPWGRGRQRGEASSAGGTGLEPSRGETKIRRQLGLWDPCEQGTVLEQACLGREGYNQKGLTGLEVT